jgi:hypothetical protein
MLSRHKQSLPVVQPEQLTTLEVDLLYTCSGQVGRSGTGARVSGLDASQPTQWMCCRVDTCERSRQLLGCWKLWASIICLIFFGVCGDRLAG